MDDLAKIFEQFGDGPLPDEHEFLDPREMTLFRLEPQMQKLHEALTSIPEDRDTLDLQADLLNEAQRHDDLVALLTPRLVEDPNNVELLLRLAEVSALLAEHYDAIRYYERARLIGKQDSPEILNPLAAEYFAEENIEKARELLERSLEMNPDQPEIRHLLELSRQQQ